MKRKETMLTACPKCCTFYMAEEGWIKLTCDKCGTELLEVPVDLEKYNAMTPEKRTELRKQYAAKHFAQATKKPEELEADDLPAPRELYRPQQRSSWVPVLGCGVWFGFAFCLFGALVTFMQGQFETGIVLAVGSVFGVGVVSLIAKIAEDVTDIKNAVNKIKSEMNNKK